MKSKIEIVLKNGYSFTFCCEKMKVQSMDNAMSGYTFEGATHPRPLYIRMDDVSAVIDEGPCEDGGQDDV